MGSALCGSKELIAKAHRLRKMAGGGWRQAGFMAAAATYALDHHVLRMAEDHQLMQHLAQGLSGIPGLQFESPETNILFIDLVGESKDKGPALQKHLKQAGIDITGFYRLRLVTHLDVDRAGVDHAIATVRQFFNA
jgi:threonine aldolase